MYVCIYVCVYIYVCVCVCVCVHMCLYVLDLVKSTETFMKTLQLLEACFVYEFLIKFQIINCMIYSEYMTYQSNNHIDCTSITIVGEKLLPRPGLD